MIKHIDGRWVLFTADGSRRLGEHDTEAEALAQERAIEASKHRSAEQARFLTLVNATGAVRREHWNGREHVVVPVVALVEGVIHAVNAPHPELVRASEFADCADWEGMPVHAGHPMRDGAPISGRLPETLPLAIGVVRNPRAAGARLTMEAWLDPSRCAADAPARILANVTATPPKMVEVSVGVFTSAAPVVGVWTNGKRYAAEWRGMRKDHLALLDDGKRGACSVEMGCGTPRAAAMRVAENGTLEELEPVPETLESTPKPCACGNHAAAAAGDGVMNKSERIAALIANPHSPIKDKTILDGLTDEGLAALETTAGTLKAAADKATTDAAALKAAQDELKAAQAPKPAQTAEEFFASPAGAPIKAVVDAHNARLASEKDAVVQSLKAATAGSFSEDELKAKPIEELQKLATLMKATVPQRVDFSFQGTPRLAAADDAATYAPPDPYAKDLAAK